jgi:hypothetical protein
VTVTDTRPRTDPAADTSRLAKLIVGKLKILELLVQLAGRQLSLVQEGEIGDLLKLLAAKQTVLGQLQTLERQLDPFRLQDPDGRQWATPEHRTRCQEHARRCDELVAEAMRLEQRSETQLVRRRDAAATVLQGVSAAVDVQAAYARPHVAATPLHLHCEG